MTTQETPCEEATRLNRGYMAAGAMAVLAALLFAMRRTTQGVPINYQAMQLPALLSLGALGTAGYTLYITQQKEEPICEEAFCPPGVVQIHTDPWWETELKDQSGGAGLTLSPVPSIPAIHEATVKARKTAQLTNPSVATVSEMMSK